MKNITLSTAGVLPSDHSLRAEKRGAMAAPQTPALIAMVGHYSDRYAQLLDDLLGDGIIVQSATGVDAGIDLITDPRLSIFILDFTPPSYDAVSLLSELRSLGWAGSVIATLPRQDARRKEALIEAGVTDVFVWPFALGDLHKRCAELIEIVPTKRADQFRIGSLQLVTASAEIYCGQKRLKLQRQQHALLCALIRNGGQVCARDYLACTLGRGKPVTPNALHRTISRLRVVIEQSDTGVELRSVRGLGYMLRATPRHKRSFEATSPGS